MVRAALGVVYLLASATANGWNLLQLGLLTSLPTPPTILETEQKQAQGTEAGHPARTLGLEATELGTGGVSPGMAPTITSETAGGSKCG